jgi:hypothetical protein
VERWLGGPDKSWRVREGLDDIWTTVL